jgi:hypothetical protein
VRSMSAEIAHRLQKSFEQNETARTTAPTHALSTAGNPA